MQMCSIAELTGFQIGHAQNKDAATGVTVITGENGQGMTAGVDVRGSAPGSRETDLLRPTDMVDQVHAVFLAGGSAYGLDAGSGIMKYLEEQGTGFDTGYAKVPIVPGAILFDLGIGNPQVRPDAQMGYQAVSTAVSPATELPIQGNVGAGTGGTAGKFAGADKAMKTGLGIAAVKVDELIVAALIAVNCFGEVVDPEQSSITPISGAYDRELQQFIPYRKAMIQNSDLADSNGFNSSNSSNSADGFNENTTIGAVMTNAELNKSTATKVAQMAHNGLSRTIRPCHSMLDGDAIFTLASGQVSSKTDLTLIGDMASLAVERALINGVLKAQSSHGFPSYNDVV